jgi:hypothetical protein
LHADVVFEDEENVELTDEFFGRLSPHINGKPVNMDDLHKALSKTLRRRQPERRPAVSSYEEVAGVRYRQIAPSPAPKRLATPAVKRCKK